MITTLRTAAAEIRRAIAASEAGAILAAWFGPVLADIARSVRVDAVAWLGSLASGRGRHAPLALGITGPVWLPRTPAADTPTSWDLPAFRVPTYMTRRAA